MDTAIYFFNDLLKLVTGKASGKTIQVKKAITVKLPEGSMINGVITDMDALQQVLMRLKKENKIEGDVRVVIDSTTILSKRCKVPMLDQQQLTKFTMDEFADMRDNYRELVCDYTVLDNGGAEAKTGTILCCAVEKDLLQRYADLFEAAEIRVASIDISINCFLKALACMPELYGKTYIFSVVENEFMTSALFVNNVYIYSSRSRLFSPAGTEEIANEILNHMSSLIQFNRSEQTKREIEISYFCGLDSETMRILAEQGQNISLPVFEMPKTKMAVLKDPRIQGVPSNYLVPLGCLIRKS